MTSKKGAKEETKKLINLARRGPTKKALKSKGSINLFLEGRRGARGFGRVPPGGVAGAPPATAGARHPQLFVKIEVFS